MEQKEKAKFVPAELGKSVENRKAFCTDFN